VREASGRGLAQQGGDDAPDVGQVVAAGGAGPLAVGAVRRRPALMVLLILPVLALLVPLAGAGGCELARWRRWMGRLLR
jgi:hypothetical protein